MNKRIKILCLLLSAIYIGVVIYCIFDFGDGMMAGYRHGKKQAQNSSTNIQRLHVKVKPIEGVYTYPDKMINTLTGQEVKAEVSDCRIALDSSDTPLPSYMKISRGVVVVLAIIVLIGLIYLPFLFFSIVKSATRGKMLEHKTIRKIQRVGYLLIIYYLINTVVYLSDFIIAKQIVTLEKYRIIFDFSDFSFLFLGLVTLLLAEILKVSVQLKEEQDLTI
ncbi:DUF2975 domain-containing protein [Dysgonomonas sp. GY617]|uniref:DUF2975 domain-containing protein n=1 Tax=Dysgonomonas sp. GY617 TaxID=2780420 RepID=UPI0018846238|nr:DUF2975 domain-containing protein [Dysgonomonas sp. GY617]MBF0574711.1 DUF2975 domain-containing protein [Dysgonomonas sp. GY617]